MSASSRAPAAGKRSAAARPPPARSASAKSGTPAASGRATPAESARNIMSSAAAARMRSPPSSQAGANLKRKGPDFDPELGGEETNINVVVRCRGRSDREVQENSGVVVSADGLKGKTVDLSLGPNALSNKTYTFDRVFSPAADQVTVFEDVVAPILDEVLGGFNCTVFAYGQTGTGKTYTMSGDISDVLPIPDDAGIIPRALHSLFDKLEQQKADSTVKCSFIELYNEELRDLLSADETTKLKIFDDKSRKNHGATMVQGMEETYIQTAQKGIQLLREGSHKRQVAATKCNDLSSRSHTVFTVTVVVKVVAQDGEEHLCNGKLNLVDLAGSENIQRSGAENKRATEAGLINKSLLTLGRVINALVEKDNHIPYRESKLTRLLQDSLGGRTKTCIIATLSPVKSNLEETISTLDYAFRAKNIRNKPQTNYPMSKKTLLREFTFEIEKLKSELIATRQRNGVYLSVENYEQLTTESESRRILSQEQRDKIDTMEVKLRNKTQDLFTLTSSFNHLKDDNETTRAALDASQDVVDRTEIALEHTRRSLSEEQMLRVAHEETEDRLTHVGRDLISTLGRTTSDISGLHSKLRRRSDLQSLNRSNWGASQQHVSETTLVVQQTLADFELKQRQLILGLAESIDSFVQTNSAKTVEVDKLVNSSTTEYIDSEHRLTEQAVQARDIVSGSLEEIKSLRDDVKQNVGQGLGGLTAAAQSISAGILTELESFHVQLHASYTSLGKDVKVVFDDLTKSLEAQQKEAEQLRRDLAESTAALVKADEASTTRIDQVLAEEKRRAAEDRADLLSQMTMLVESHGAMQERRLQDKLDEVKSELKDNSAIFLKRQDAIDSAMESLASKDGTVISRLLESQESVENRIQQDWCKAEEQNLAIQDTSRAVYQETVCIVDQQMRHIDDQLQALDDVVSRVRAQNDRQHATQVQSLKSLGIGIRQSYIDIAESMEETSTRVQEFATGMSTSTQSMRESLELLPQEAQLPLADLRTDVLGATIAEYTPTGETPQKTSYQYTRELPRTEKHRVLLKRFHGQEDSPGKRNSPVKKDSPVKKETASEFDSLSPVFNLLQSPSKALVFADVDLAKSETSSPVIATPASAARPATSSGTGLRELSVNLISAAPTVDVLMPPPPLPVQQPARDTTESQPPPLKKQKTSSSNGSRSLSASIGPGTKMPKRPMRAIAEGRENQPLSASVGPGGTGRVLRSRTS